MTVIVSDVSDVLLANTAVVTTSNLDLFTNVDTPGRSYAGRNAITSVVRHGVTYQAHVFWNDDLKAVLRIRNRGSNQTNWSSWRTFVLDGTNGTPDIELDSISDDHYSVTVGLDPKGIIHIAYNTRNSPLLYRRSTLPIELFQGVFGVEENMVSGDNESSCNYIQFDNDFQGNMVCWFRRGGAGDGLILFYRYDHRSATPFWEPLPGTETTVVGGDVISGVLIDGESTYNTAYIYGVGFHKDFDVFGGRQTGSSMHIAFHWRSSAATPKNLDLTYVGWNGADFHHADGTGQGVPISSRTVTDVADPVAAGEAANEGLGGASNVACTSENLPAIAYYKNDGSGYGQAYVVAFNGTSWGTPFSPTSNSSNLQDQDPEDFYRSPRVMFRQDDDLMVLLVTGFEHTGYSAFYCDNYYSGAPTWTEVQLVTDPVSDWSPACDTVEWRNNNLISAVQGSDYFAVIEQGFTYDDIPEVSPTASTIPAVPSDATREAAILAWLSGLESDGILAKLDVLNIYMYGLFNQSLQEYISGSHLSTYGGAINFEPWHGFKTSGYGTGTYNSYLNTRFSPSRDGVLYTRNDAHFGFYSLLDKQDDNVSGARNTSGGTKQNVITPRNTSDQCRGQINGGGLDTFGSNTNGSGHFIIERTSSTAIEAYRNGVSIGTASEGSDPLIDEEFYIGGRNNSDDGQPTSLHEAQVAFFHAGESLGVTLAAAFAARNATLAAAMGW